jgi:CHAD domain-containing protein
MSFELKKGKKIPKTVRKIVCGRIDKALETLNGKARRTSDHAVHNARKRFKEIRGTIRLVREELGEKTFRRENRTYRDAGRPLSAVRDAKVLVDTLDGLIKHFRGRARPANVPSLRRALLEQRRDTRKRVLEKDHAVSGIVKRVRAARRRVKNWPLQKRGWKAIQGGLLRVYRQGRDAMRDAIKAVRNDDSCDEAMHEWRKRTKDFRYELELLEPVWPQTLTPLAEQAHHLTDLLGEDHDLAVLRSVVQDRTKDKSSGDGDTDADGDPDAELLLALIDERRTALQKEALELGQKLYEETPPKFVARIRGYWKASASAPAA